MAEDEIREEEVPGAFLRATLTVQCWNTYEDGGKEAFCGAEIVAELEHPSFAEVDYIEKVPRSRYIEDLEVHCPRCSARTGRDVVVMVQILVGAQCVVDGEEEEEDEAAAAAAAEGSGEPH